MRTARPARFAAGLLVLAAAGCDIPLYPVYDDFHDFEGRYFYSGEVHGAWQYNVIGTIRITHQHYDEARVTIDWRYREGSRTLLELRTESPAVARIDRHGRIRFDFFGEFYFAGQWIPFELEHRGRLHRHTITGTWYLWTGLNTEESGSFEARR
jgi:hypothetical protein